MSNVPNRNDWKFGLDLSMNSNILKNKQELINQYYLYMLNRTRRMFEYEGLENELTKDTLNIRRLEQLTQVNGYSFLVNVKNPGNKYPKGIYALRGFLGGLEDPNGVGTKATINNVALGFNEILTVGKDCILIPNDSTFIGLDPVFSLYSSLLADVDISLRYALINSRVPNMYNGQDSQMKKDLEAIYEDIEQGTKICGCLVTNPFFDGLKNAISSSTYEGLIKELLEAKQYLLSNWFIFLGLQSNYNMKREAINSTEAGMNEDSLIPLIDDMLENRNDALKEANKVFGTSLNCKLSSAWSKVHEDYKAVEKEEVDSEEPKEKEKEGEPTNENE